MFLNRHVETLAWTFWNGSEREFPYFIQPSSTLWSLVEYREELRRDNERENRAAMFRRDVKSWEAHRVQFTYWKNGVHNRYILDACTTIGMAITLYTIIQLFLNALDRIAINIIKCTRQGQCTQQDYSDLAIVMRETLVLNDCIFAILALSLGFLGEHFVKAFYSYMVRGTLFVDYAFLCIDLMLTVIASYFYFVYYPITQNLRSSTLSDQEFVNNFLNASQINMQSWYATEVFCMWIRVLLYFGVSSYIGPFIKSIQVMILSVWQFALVYVSLLVLFSLMFTLLAFMYRHENFLTVGRTMLTLFQSTLGVYDLNALPNDTVFQLFYVLFIVLCSIVLLNILVALLTQVHENYQYKGTGLYLYEIFKLRDIYSPHPTYEYLTHSFFPFSVLFAILFLPWSLVLSPSNKETLCSVVLHVEYAIVLILALPLYLAIELLLYPIAYLKCLVHKAVLVFVETEEPRVHKLGHLLLFLILGPVILMGNLLGDVYYFVVHCYATSENAVVPSPLSERYDIPLPIYEAVLKLLANETASHVDLKTFCNRIRELVSQSRSVAQDVNHSRVAKFLGFGHAFHIAALVNLMDNVALPAIEGHKQIEVRLAREILRANLVIPRLRRLYRKPKSSLKYSVVTVSPAKNISLSNDRGVTSQTIQPFSTTVNTATRKVSMRLLKWYNYSRWKAALSRGTNNQSTPHSKPN